MHRDQLSDAEVRALAYRVEEFNPEHPAFTFAQWMTRLGLEANRLANPVAGAAEGKYWARVSLNDRYNLWLTGVGKPRDAYAAAAVTEERHERKSNLQEPPRRGLRGRDVKVEVKADLSRRRKVLTQLGTVWFRVPGEMERVSEQYRWDDEVHRTPFGYGQYQFLSHASGDLILQVVVLPGSTRGKQTAEQQMNTEIAAREASGTAAQAWSAGVVKALHAKVPLIELKDRYRRTVQASLPVEGGTITLFLSERVERGGELTAPLKAILRTVRVQAYE